MAYTAPHEWQTRLDACQTPTDIAKVTRAYNKELMTMPMDYAGCASPGVFSVMSSAAKERLASNRIAPIKTAKEAQVSRAMAYLSPRNKVGHMNDSKRTYDRARMHRALDAVLDAELAPYEIEAIRRMAAGVAKQKPLGNGALVTLVKPGAKFWRNGDEYTCKSVGTIDDHGYADVDTSEGKKFFMRVKQ